MPAVSTGVRPDFSGNPSGVVRLRDYRPELDVVRFLAFLLVFLFHFLPWPAVGQAGWRVQMALVELCSMGLCLFFTLSAYLITTILLAERETNCVISVPKFYIRRILRIWPLYFFGIALGIGIALERNRPGDVIGFLWYLLFAGNLYCIAFGWLGNSFAPLWTISIEEQFYLIWPWAIRWFSRRGMMVCSFLFIAAANITLFILGQRHALGREVWANTFVQFEMFAAGILLALARKHLAWRCRHWTALGARRSVPLVLHLPPVLLSAIAGNRGSNKRGKPDAPLPADCTRQCRHPSRVLHDRPIPYAALGNIPRKDILRPLCLSSICN